MDWIVERRTKFGKYYIVKAILNLKGKKKYTVRQSVGDLRKLRSEWKLTKKQMLSILKNTDPEEWFIKVALRFDGSVDGLVPVDRDFRPLRQGEYKWVHRAVDESGYEASYDAKNRTFELSSLALGTFYLKPRENIVTLEIPPELKAKMLVFLL